MNKSEIDGLGQVSPQIAEMAENPRNYGPLEHWNG
jgi:hypothetical protein